MNKDDIIIRIIEIAWLIAFLWIFSRLYAAGSLLIFYAFGASGQLVYSIAFYVILMLVAIFLYFKFKR